MSSSALVLSTVFSQLWEQTEGTRARRLEGGGIQHLLTRGTSLISWVLLTSFHHIPWLLRRVASSSPCMFYP